MRHLAWLPIALAAIGCKKDHCDPLDPEDCKDGLVCEEVEGEEDAQCFAPVVIEGTVRDLTDDSAIAGARVVALDVNNAARSSVAVSDESGAWSLQVPTKRDAEGAPTSVTVTLRADADAYLTFPSGVRQALPVDTTTPVEEDERWVYANTSTDIGLIPTAEGAGRGILQGTVEAPGEGQGVLVVAEAGGVGRTAVADSDGGYVIFNLDEGTKDVTAYAQGVVYESVQAAISGTEATTVDVNLADDAAGTVTGNIQVVNGGGAGSTSVILVLESTFDELLIRGETPPGLRVGGISGAYTIEGVAPGAYVVLAAFENDGLVRDPDTSIGGTAIQHITVSDGTTTVEGFKVTGALEVTAPGAAGPEAVDIAPTLSWLDDSSEDLYEVEVFDAYGTLVWTFTEDGHSGDDPAVAYGGPLEHGMYYQFRVTSIKDDVPISRTEDLKGVFFYTGE